MTPAATADPPAADLIVRGASQVLTMRGAAGPRSGRAQGEIGIVERGAVAVRGGKIAQVGPEYEVLAAWAPGGDAVVVDARGGLVTPGLVDCHTHLVFAGMRQAEFEQRALGASYADIHAAGGGIAATVRATRASSLDQLVDLAEPRLAEMLRSGTTTAEAKSGYGLDRDTELRQLEAVRALQTLQPVELVPTYLGAHSVPADRERAEYVEWLCEAAIPEVAKRRLAVFCDVFCERGLFTPEESRRILKAGRKHGLAPKLHADELTDSGGAALAAAVHAVSADHLHCANDAGLQALAEAGTVGVLLPGTAVFLGIDAHAPARRMMELGVPIALATDFNPGSCFCTSLALILSLACTQLRLSPAEAWVAATINAASAVALGDRLGSLDAGKQADIVVWDADDYRIVPYAMGSSLVRTVVKRGSVVFERS